MATILQSAGPYTFYDFCFICSVPSKVEIAEKTGWKQFRIIVMAITIIPEWERYNPCIIGNKVISHALDFRVLKSDSITCN